MSEPKKVKRDLEELRRASLIISALYACVPILTGKNYTLGTTYVEVDGVLTLGVAATDESLAEDGTVDGWLLALLPSDKLNGKVVPVLAFTPSEEDDEFEEIYSAINYNAEVIRRALADYFHRCQEEVKDLLAGADVHFLDENGNEITLEDAVNPDRFEELPPIPRPKNDYVN